MNWKKLTTAEELESAISESSQKPVLIFKHSTRCSISSASLDRIERKWDKEADTYVTAYFLDLIRYRDLSHLIAQKTEVYHQSPQAILLKEGKSIYDESHFSIDYDEIITLAKSQLIKS